MRMAPKKTETGSQRSTARINVFGKLSPNEKPKRPQTSMAPKAGSTK